MEEMKNEINEMKGKHESILYQHLDEIKQHKSHMDQTILTLKEIEESNKVTLTLEYSSKISEFSKLLPNINVSLPSFSAGNIDKKQIHKLFGSLTPVSITRGEEDFKLNKTADAAKELLEVPELIRSFNTRYEYVYGVTCLTEEDIWICGNTGNLRCLTIKSSVKKNVNTKSGNYASDLTLTNDGDLLYSDPITRTVNKMKNGRVEEVIKLQGWIPKQLCISSSGDLLVTMHSDDETKSKVVRYSNSTEKQTIQFDDSGIPLYTGSACTKYISENRNLDICVADFMAGAVLVVNQAGKLRFRYTGHSSTTKKQPFKPWGITTDSRCQILTSNTDNHCIHILDQNGQFIRYIDNCGLNEPTVLCMDKNDNLLVAGHSTGRVRQIRYVKK